MERLVKIEKIAALPEMKSKSHFIGKRRFCIRTAYWQGGSVLFCYGNAKDADFRHRSIQSVQENLYFLGSLGDFNGILVGACFVPAFSLVVYELYHQVFCIRTASVDFQECHAFA